MASTSQETPSKLNSNDEMTTGSSPFSPTWDSLPMDIVCTIMSYLPLKLRVPVALTCSRWYSAFQQPRLWQDFACIFRRPADQQFISYADLYGRYFKSVSISVDQAEKENRNRALTFLGKLTELESRRLTSFTLTFVGQNPCFYAGIELVNAVHDLFIKEVTDDNNLYKGLLRVDLSKFSASFDDKLLRALCWKNTNLTHLNIQTPCLVTKVTPEGVLALVKTCRQLVDLTLIYCTMNDEVLEELAKDDRAPLQHLSVVCRREEKYRKELTSEAWGKLAKRWPQLRVTLKFDNTCPLFKVSLIMKPEIPVKTLLMETFTHIEEELKQATSYYSATVNCVVLHTQNSGGLGSALVSLARHSPGLECLKVYCVLKKETVNKILEVSPLLRKTKNYILKWQPETEPWVVGQESGD